MGVKDYFRLARQRLAGEYSQYKLYPELEYHGGMSQQDGFAMAKDWEHYRVLYYFALLWLPLLVSVIGAIRDHVPCAGAELPLYSRRYNKPRYKPY